jgi:hypothetical protein
LYFHDVYKYYNSIDWKRDNICLLVKMICILINRFCIITMKKVLLIASRSENIIVSINNVVYFLYIENFYLLLSAVSSIYDIDWNNNSVWRQFPQILTVPMNLSGFYFRWVISEYGQLNCKQKLWLLFINYWHRMFFAIDLKFQVQVKFLPTKRKYSKIICPQK